MFIRAIPTNKIAAPHIPSSFDAGIAIIAPIAPPPMFWLPNSYALDTNVWNSYDNFKVPFEIWYIVITDIKHSKNTL